MRPIVKGAEPPPFAAWRRSGNADWQPSYSDLRQPLKPIVKDALLQEQGHVCCYCERRVAADSDSHIEHLEPQSVRPELQLDYDNLLCSCSSPSHCGQARGNKQLPVHPLQYDCSEFFDFGSNGGMKPRDSVRAPDGARTIDALGLDAEPLRDRRRRALDDFFTAVSADPPGSWLASARTLLARDSSGRFVPHATAVADVIRRSRGSP